jgi:hypothetical protein
MNETATQDRVVTARPVARFLIREFDVYAEGLGYVSDSQKAVFVGCGQATMSRIRAGRQNPGAQFIAGVYRAVAGAPGNRTGAEFFDFCGSDR